MGKTTHEYGAIRLAAGAIAIALLLAAALPLFGASNADVLFYEGVNAYLRGDVPAAAAALGRALQADPGHERAQRLLQEVNAELARRNPSRAGSPATPSRPVNATAPTAPVAPVAVPTYPVATQPHAVINPVPLTGPMVPAGPGEGLVQFGALPVDVPTAVAVPVAPLQPLLRERLALRGAPDAAVAGSKSLTAIEVYSENADLKVRLTGTAGLDFLESKVYTPPMVIIDLPGCRDALPNRPLAVDAGGLVRVRHTRGRSEPLETTRVILDLTQVSPYSIERVAGGVLITFPNAGRGTGARAVLGEPPFFAPRQTLTTPLSTYRVQSQWLRIVSGEKQLGPAGSRLPAPLAAQVTDAQGAALADVPVTFTVTEGNGYFLTAGGEKVATLTLATDGNGQAFAGNYFLATQAGDNVVLAALGEARASGVTFLETSLPGTPVELAKIHGDEQEGLVAGPTEEPLVVEVRDRYRNPVSGVRVIFTVLYNDGVADVNPDRWGTQSVVSTDEHGRARLDQFKLGTRVGLNRVRASIVVEDAADVRGGLIITPRRFEGRRPGESEEIRREHPETDQRILLEEIFRFLPTAAEDEIRLVSVGDVNAETFREKIVAAAQGANGSHYFAEMNTLYVQADPAALPTWEKKLAELPDATIERRVIRSVVFKEYGRPQLISVDFKDASVVDVIRTLAEIANWNVVFPGSGDDLFTKQVTIHLIEVPAKTVLDNILRQVKYARVESNGIIRIVPKAEMSEQEVRLGIGADLDQFEGEEDEIITYLIPVRNRKPSDLLNVIRPLAHTDAKLGSDDVAMKIIVTDRVANIRRLVAAVRLLDITSSDIAAANMVSEYITLENLRYDEVKSLVDFYALTLTTKSEEVNQQNQTQQDRYTAAYQAYFNALMGVTQQQQQQTQQDPNRPQVIPVPGSPHRMLLIVPQDHYDRLIQLIRENDIKRALEPFTVPTGIDLAEVQNTLTSLFSGIKIYPLSQSSKLLISADTVTMAELKEVFNLIAGGGFTQAMEVITLPPEAGTNLATTLAGFFPGARITPLGTVGNRILVSADTETMVAIKDLLGKIGGNQAFTVITISSLKPSEVTQLLTTMSPQFTGVAMDRVNKLVLYGSAENVARMEEIVRQLDVAGTQGKEVLIFSLARIKPADMQEILTQLNPALQTMISATGNWLIALVPQDQVAELKAMIERIDRDMTTVVEESMLREVIRLERLDPSRAEQIVKQAFPGAQAMPLGQIDQAPVYEWSLTGGWTATTANTYRGLYGLLVIANRQDMPLIREMLKAMDLSPLPEGFAMTVYKPKYQSSQSLQQWVNELMGTEVRQGKIFYDPRTNRLLIWDSPENTQLLLGFFEKVDVSPSEGMVVRSVVLGNVSAREMADFLPTIYTGSFTASAVTGKNLIFVQVPREVVDEVLATIRQIDQMPVGDTIAVIPLSVYVTPSEIESKLKTLYPNLNFMSNASPPMVVASGDEASVRKVREIVAELDQPLVTKTIRLIYGDATSIASTLTPYLSTNGRVQADGRTNTLVITEVGSNLARLDKIIHDLDISLTSAGGESATTKVFKLKNAQATELVSTLSNVVAATRGTGNLNVLLGSLSADVRTNSILVNSTASDLPLIAALIEQLDVRTPQVLIEATILEYSLDEHDDLGFQWNFSDRLGQYNYSTVFNGLVGGAFTMTLTKGQLSVVMDALQSTNRTEILSAPKMMTLNNEPASIVVGTTRQQITNNYDDQGNLTSQTYTDKKADLNLSVTPQIGADRTVKLDFDLDLEQFIPTTSQTELPTNTRKLTNSVLVADEQTLVIGGIIRDEKSLANTGIPFLRDLPGIGKLFAGTSDQKAKVELMIFITPRVVASPAEGDQVTRWAASQSHQITPLPVNINTAIFDELIKLPGLKAEQDPRQAGIIASRIVRHRELYGPYQSLEELKFVPGIDERIFEDIVYRLKYKIEVNVISIEELRQLKGVTLPIAKGLVDYRKAHGLFTEYDAVRKVFLSLGMPAETYDAYLGDIVYIGNVYREEREVSAGPAGPATFRPGPVVATTPTGTFPITLPGPTPRTSSGQGTRVTPPTPPPIAPTTTTPPAPTPTPSAADAGKVNLNTATVDQLKGVGFDDLGARLVVAWRNRYGPYHAVEDLKGVIGITPALYERVKDKVTVGAVPAAEENGIMLMPSVPVDDGVLPATTVSSAGTARLDLNQASAEELASVTGLDPMKAKMIVAYRHTYGDFTGVEQLQMVPTVTATDYNQAAPYLFVR